MAKMKIDNALYFSHDADMRNDIRVKALRRQFPHNLGYSVWCMLLEVLTDSDFFYISWDEITIDLLAADFDVTPKELREVVGYCQKIGLFTIADDRLFSDKHRKRLQEVVESREKRAAAGRAGMKSRWGSKGGGPDNNVITGDNTHLTPDNKGNEIKGEESKGKQRKGKGNNNGNSAPYPFEEIVALWNTTCVKLPAVTKLSDARRDKIKARLAEFGEPYSWMPTIESLFETIAASDFLCGVKTEWAASFDWLFSNSTNWVKVLEGNYANKGQQHTATSGGPRLGIDERIENGVRTYGTGRVAIPMEAPPRPGDKWWWNADLQEWSM